MNDVVTPTTGFDPPQGYRADALVIDMGGPSILVASEIQIWVIWNPDGTIPVSPAIGLLACASSPESRGWAVARLAVHLTGQK